MDQGLSYLIQTSSLPISLAVIGIVFTITTLKNSPQKRLLHLSHWLLILFIIFYGVVIVTAVRSLVPYQLLHYYLLYGLFWFFYL